SIQEFALNLTIGIVVGTYSSIFIASQILLLWIRGRDKRQKRLNAIKYGTRETVAVAKVEGGEAVDGDEEKHEIAIPHAERKLKGKRKKK
ncbi:MAG TPA: protein translocase subunit SecF, partial [Spirochaetia bacterium]|nr:protein translocase subunit SecF [Spirochaetia bacterium]